MAWSWYLRMELGVPCEKIETVPALWSPTDRMGWVNEEAEFISKGSRSGFP